MATQIYRERVVRTGPEVHDVPTSAPATNTIAPETQSRPWQRGIYFILNVLEVILAIRLVLQLVGASTVSAFTRFMYGITDPFIAPFRGIFTPTSSGTGVLEWATVVAMVVYALIVYAIVRAADISQRRSV